MLPVSAWDRTSVIGPGQQNQGLEKLLVYEPGITSLRNCYLWYPQFADETMEAERSVTCSGSFYKKERLGVKLAILIPLARLFALQQSAATAETVVRKGERRGGGGAEKKEWEELRGGAKCNYRREINF